MSKTLTVNIIKIPRLDPIPIIEPNFPSLKTLHLDLLENKRKLKPGLPLIPFIPPKPRVQPLATQAPPPKLDDEKDDRHDHDDHHHRGSRTPSEAGSDLREFEEDHRDHHHDDDHRDDDVMSQHSNKGDDDAHSVKDEKEQSLEQKQTGPYVSPAEQEKLDKEEMLWRIRILKKQYGEAPIPEFNEHSDLATMKCSYDRTVRELYFEDSLHDYRSYLTYGFYAVEFICTKWFDVKELDGFSNAQARHQRKYDRLLIELGEKNYMRGGTKLPVELRLVGLVVFQAASFYVGKMIAAKFMDDQPSSQQKKPTAKMKGPSVKLEDLQKN